MRSPTITSLVGGCCFFFFLPRQSNWFPQLYSSRAMFLTWKTRNQSIQFSTRKKKSFPAEINQTKVVSLSVERDGIQSKSHSVNQSAEKISLKQNKKMFRFSYQKELYIDVIICSSRLREPFHQSTTAWKLSLIISTAWHHQLWAVLNFPIVTFPFWKKKILLGIFDFVKV